MILLLDIPNNFFCINETLIVIAWFYWLKIANLTWLLPVIIHSLNYAFTDNYIRFSLAQHIRRYTSFISLA